MITSVFTQGCAKIITLFSLAPGSQFNRKYIQGKTLMHNVPLDSSLLRLTSAGILKRERNNYGVNFGSEGGKALLGICSNQFRQMRELPLAVHYLLMDFADMASTLKDVEIILFGSYAKLTYTQKSDIDIAVLQGAGTSRKQAIAAMAAKLEKAYGMGIELHHFHKDSFYRNKKDPLVKSILADGIRIV